MRMALMLSSSLFQGILLWQVSGKLECIWIFMPHQVTYSSVRSPVDRIFCSVVTAEHLSFPLLFGNLTPDLQLIPRKTHGRIFLQFLPRRRNNVELPSHYSFHGCFPADRVPRRNNLFPDLLLVANAINDFRFMLPPTSRGGIVIWWISKSLPAMPF